MEFITFFSEIVGHWSSVIQVALAFPNSVWFSHIINVCWLNPHTWIHFIHETMSNSLWKSTDIIMCCDIYCKTFLLSPVVIRKGNINGFIPVGMEQIRSLMDVHTMPGSQNVPVWAFTSYSSSRSGDALEPWRTFYRKILVHKYCGHLWHESWT